MHIQHLYIIRQPLYRNQAGVHAQSGVSIEMTGTTTLETSGSLYFLAVSVVVCVVDSSWFWRFLWREYDILPYSWRKGHTPRRNWQKSLRIPNHPKNNSNIFIIQTYPKLSLWFSFKLAHKLVNNSMQIHPQTHMKNALFSPQ